MDLKEKIKRILLCFSVMIIGLILLKYLPMDLFGKDILFDASAHIVFTAFVLYLFWYFIDQNPNLRIPYLILASAILIIVAISRFLAKAHNEIGIISGIVISLFAILISRWDYFKGKLSF